MQPRLVVLLIGTNNLPYAPPENIALGTAEIVRWIHHRSPETRVLIVGILPRGQGPGEPLRAKAAEVNRLTARCADGRTTFFTDIGRNFVDANGLMSNEVTYDFLHFTQVGYALMAASLEPDIKRIMGE